MPNPKLADTSQAEVRYKREAQDEWGVVVPTTVARDSSKRIRFTSEDLSIDNTTVQSEEIRKDKQIPNLILTKVDASGGISGEVSFETYDDFIEGLLGLKRTTNGYATGWNNDVDQSNVNAAVNAAGNLSFLSTAAAGVVNLQIGQAIQLSGFANNANNRIVVVIGKPASTGNAPVIVNVAPKLAPEAYDVGTRTTNSIRMRGQSITNNLDLPSFTIEKEFFDVKKIIAYFGMKINQMSLSVESESKLSTSFSFMGSYGEPQVTYDRDGVELESESVFGSHDVPVVSNDNEIMISGTQGSTILQDNKEIGIIKMLSIEATNNLRSKPAVGTTKNIGIGEGRLMVTGSISTYFKDFQLYDKFVKNSSASLVFTIGDNAGNKYVFYLPKVKFTESKVMSGGPDQDVMIDGSYQAIKGDQPLEKTLVITKISA